MHKLTCCYKENACDKCVIHADRKFCFIEATQTVFDNLLRCQLQHLFRLAVAVYRFTCFCRAILPITEPSHELLCVILLIFLFTLLSILRIMVLMHVYYEKLLRKYPDVVTVKDVVTLTGYTLTTVHNWCTRGSLKAFQKGLKFCIPKIFLVDFFCSLTFRSITRKSLWHIQTLNDFQRKMKHRK